MASTETITVPEIETVTESSHPTRCLLLMMLVMLGASLNAFILVAVFPHRGLRTTSNLLRCQLALCGFLTSVIVMPMKSVGALLGGWPGPLSSCPIIGIIACILETITCWTIVQLSTQKYNTISVHLQYSQSHRRMLIHSLVVVLVALTLVGMTFFPFESSFDEFTLLCMPDVCSSANTWSATFYVVSTYYVSAAIVVFCYVCILRMTHRRGQQVAVLGAPTVPRTSHLASNSRPRYASLTVIQIILAFCVCYIPYMAMLTYRLAYHQDPPSFVLHLGTGLHQMAPTINAFVYGVNHRVLRTAFCDFLRTYLRPSLSTTRPSSALVPSSARVFTVDGLSWTQDEISLPIMQPRSAIYRSSEIRMAAQPTHHSYPN